MIKIKTVSQNMLIKHEAFCFLSAIMHDGGRLGKAKMHSLRSALPKRPPPRIFIARKQKAHFFYKMSELCKLKEAENNEIFNCARRTFIFNL